MAPLLIPTATSRTEIVIQKSRFLSTAQRMDSPDEAKTLIQAQRTDHPKANHVVWAYVLGDQSRQDSGMSDDGEPSGTSGRPTLTVLQKSGLTHCLITTVRYFGGMKLGTGGLVRAYTEAAQKVLAALSTEAVERRATFSLTAPYDLYDPIRHLLDQSHVTLEESAFTGRVTLQCSIAEEEFASLKDQLIEQTAAKIEIELIEIKSQI